MQKKNDKKLKKISVFFKTGRNILCYLLSNRLSLFPSDFVFYAFLFQTRPASLHYHKISFRTYGCLLVALPPLILKLQCLAVSAASLKLQ